MLFITLGTQACDFSRCLKMVEELVERYNIEEPIIAQVGYTKYKPKNVACFEFVSESEYQRYMEEARIIITHAGTGAIFSAIKHRKKTIAVARLAKYGEMINDHQTEIVSKLANDGYILDGTYSLVDTWEKISDFIPRQNDFTCELPIQIKKTLDAWGINKKNL